MTGPDTNRRPDKALLRDLFDPVDIASLVFFRIAFGAIMVWETYRYFDHGWIERYFVNPTFYFSYFGFEWLRPWPGSGMYVHFYVLGLLAALIALGAFYRIASILFFVGFTFVFLLDETNYLNHFYLISLISFIMAIVPANRDLSIDVLRRPQIRANTVPAWSLWLLRFQIGVAYFFGGVAKLNGDWLRGEPMRSWLAQRGDFPIIGGLFEYEWMVYIFVYGGLLLDLLAPFALLWRRTRVPAYLAIVVFHFINAQLFSIGIFPWFMIVASTIFFEPDWPRRLFHRLRRQKSKTLLMLHPIPRHWRLLLAFLALYCGIQIVMPLRHFAYPGNVSWSEEGHMFSWHMKLRDKDPYEVEFYGTDPASGRTWQILPRRYLSNRQRRKMPGRPRMIQQFAKHVAEVLDEEGLENVEIRVYALVALNGREPQLMIDPDVDLVAQPRTIAHVPWIVPLEQPLPPTNRRR